MSISGVEKHIPNAVSIEVSRSALSVELSDGRTIPIPVDRYPRLAYATHQERTNWRIMGAGHGIHWEDIDEDISVEGLLAGNRSGESTASLKRWLAATRQPEFQPWKGESYGTPNDLGLPASLLILGESHYGDPKDWGRGITIRVVREYCEGAGYAFFTKILHTVLGPDAPADTSEQRCRFYESTAFCNYVQRSVGPTSDCRPIPEMWEEAAAPFSVTLECLRPTHIVVCGMDLWDNMPAFEGVWAPPSETLIRWFDSVGFPTSLASWRQPSNLLGCYGNSEGQSVVLAIQHPSWRYYQTSAWHPVVERFLQYRPE